MSTKTTIRKIALVAVSALGLGLLSVVPASAAVTAISDATLAASSSLGDPTVVVTSVVTTAKSRQYNVYTANATVPLTDLTVTVPNTAAAGTDALKVFLAIGSLDLTSGAQTARLTSTQTSATGIAGFSLDSGSPAVTTPAPTGVTVSTLAASTSGTAYTFFAQLGANTLGTPASGNAFIQIVVYQSTATASTATLGTTTTTLAGRVGQQVTITPTAAPAANTIANGINFPQFSVAASITSQPTVPTGQSTVYPKITAVTTAMTGLGYVYAKSGLTAGSTAASTSTSSTGDASTVASINYSANPGTSISVSTTQSAIGTVTFTPVAAGTYSLTVWNESSTSGTPALSGTESYQVFTINVAASVSTVALSAINSVASKAGSNGSLIKVTLKDAAGNASTLAPGEVVTITPSGSGLVAGVNGVATSGATAGGAYNLSAANFDASGRAWINVTDSVAETSTITASVNGGVSSSTSVSFKTITASTVAPAPYSATSVGYALSSGSLYNMPLGGATITFTVTVGSAGYANYTVKENAAGAITGDTGRSLSYDAAALGGATDGVSYYSVTATQLTDSTNTYSVFSVANASLNVAGTVETRVQGKTNTAGVLSVSPASVNAVAGSTNTLTATLKDLFGRAYASQSVTASVAGKNPTTVSATLVTDANGKVTYSVTDANTNSAVNDTVTFSSGSSASAVISYGANAVDKVTVTSDDTTASVANDTVTPQAIATGYAGATGGARTVTATVKNAAGALLAGVPVTFTVSGTGAAVTSTTQTVYTGVAGTASASVYGWITGTYTVTATAGGKSGTATETFYSTGNDSVRTVSAKADGANVTGTAKDRYGNPVSGATLYIKITSGAGNIGGLLTTSGTTDSTGQVTWVVSGGAASVSVSNISFSSPAGTVVGQTGAAKGYDIGGAGATAITAYVAGTTTTAEKGVGSTYADAGVATATVDVAGSTQSSDAVDAANEATDAANAATDAANAAAEAADAATAAAQDAQAAVADLAAQVATLIAGIKAQITALTNLVIKIQKKVKA